MIETKNNVFISLFDQIGRDELQKICDSLNINRKSCNKFAMTEHFFK